MDMIGILPLGFVVGMAHAMEADHLAAVAAMVESDGNKRAVISRGAFWGLGHTISLLLICGAFLTLGITISGGLEAGFELAVGLMIMGLGAQVLWRLKRNKVHIHVHSHGGVTHIHAHQHGENDGVHDGKAHDHLHVSRKRNIKALIVGLMHGAAGSAGLLVLIVAATHTVWQSLLYFTIFGLGTILGMASLTAIASYPLALVQRGALWVRTGTSLAIGTIALLIGGNLALTSLTTLQLLGR